MLARIGLLSFLLLGAARVADAQTQIVGWGEQVFDSSWHHESFADVAAGGYNTMALRSDGTLAIWGSNIFGQANPPTLAPGLAIVEFAMGGHQAIAFPPFIGGHAVARLSDGSVIAWGENTGGECNVPPPPPGLAYVHVAAGAYDTLAILSDGTAVECGPISSTALPPPPPAGLAYIDGAVGGLSPAGGYCLARLTDGSVIAWGDNSSGQCNVPVPSPGLAYAQVAAGYYHALGLLSDGSVIAWGDNSAGQCDVPALPPGLRYVRIAADGSHSVALRSDGSVVAWGDNSAGEGNVPAPPPGLTYINVSAGASHTAAQLSDGTIICWGDNSVLQGNAPAPPPGLSYTQIVTNGGPFLDSGVTNHTVALRSDGSIIAWGDNSYGQCNLPTLPPGVSFTNLAAGWLHTVALCSDGSVVAWGGNGSGQCNVPSLPPGLSYAEVAAGAYHTMARRSDGVVLAWGANNLGDCDVPQFPVGVTPIRIAAGGENSMALLSDGSIVAWGELSTADVPALPSGLSYVEPTAGSGQEFGPYLINFCGARRSDGSAVYWGENYWGECDVPPLPPGLTYTNIAAGCTHSAAVRSDGVVISWGNNLHHQCDGPTPPTGLELSHISAGGDITVALLETRFVITPFCFGDGSEGPCPCGNTGLPGHGCNNSAGTGGALLSASGQAHLSADKLLLTASGERSTSFSLFWQGGSEIAPRVFGDGIGCMGSPLVRLFFHPAVGGAVVAPQGSDPSVSARSAAMGDVLTPGDVRVYHVFYRDPDPNFCAWPLGSSFNTTNGLRILWEQ